MNILSPRTATRSRALGSMLAFAGAALLVACSGAGSAGPANDGDVQGGEAASQPVQETSDSGTSADDEYAFGVEREDLSTAIEQAFSSSNAKVRWEGDTIYLAIDGDATETMAGFTDCRVLSHLLLETDESVIEFPNGSVSCAEVLDVG